MAEHEFYGQLAQDDVTGLATALAGKADVGHTHSPPTPHQLTYGATLTPNWANGEHQWCTLTGDTEVDPPTNIPSGKTLTLSLVASGAARTVTIDSTIQRILGVNASIVIESGKLLILGIQDNPAAAGLVVVAKGGT